MKQEIAEQWAAALRSGEYKQGLSYLHTRSVVNDESYFCCLGVLCELAVQEEVLPPARAGLKHVVRADVEVQEYGDSYAILPVEVVEWAGMSDGKGSFWSSAESEDEPEALVCRSLVQLNDSGISFEKIATVIEERHTDL